MEDSPYVVFSQRAFNAIVTETIDKHPIETGGILLGYVLDNGAWIVVENIPPGYQSVHQTAYFEYDEEFVTYLSNVVAKQYIGNLRVLGLWHRHPGSMDVFSNTDDGTNIMFARTMSCGAISALVNCDPQLRLTMFHVDQQGNYKTIEWYVDDGETIPKQYLALHYTDADNLPYFNRRGIMYSDDVHDTSRPDPEDCNDRKSDEIDDNNTIHEDGWSLIKKGLKILFGNGAKDKTTTSPETSGDDTNKYHRNEM